MTKICKKCEVEKAISEYRLTSYKDKRYPANICKKCNQSAKKSKREENKSRSEILKAEILSVETHRICNYCKESKSLKENFTFSTPEGKYLSRCRTCNNKLALPNKRKQFLLYKDTLNARNRDKYAKDTEYRSNLSEKHKAWRNDNKDFLRESYRNYYYTNKDLRIAQTIHRRACKIKAVPKFSNKKYVKIFYELAKEESIRTGKICHVDHIVPLKSIYVCGLHYEHNLQILFAEDNLRKGNYYWPNMSDIRDPELKKMAKEFYAKVS